MEKYKIKDIGRVITGKTPSTKENRYYNANDFMFICPADIKNVRLLNKSNKYISLVAFTNFKSIQLNPNTIVIDCIGADLGNVSLTQTKCMTNQQINSITEINTGIAYPMYLYYYFSTKKEYFHLIGQNGSTMPIINKSMFENIEIIIHSLFEQQHIVNIVR